MGKLYERAERDLEGLARGGRLRFGVVGSVRVVLCLCLVFVVSVAETSGYLAC